ncbi:hypothetical protein [Gimesia sp.]|uniref:hypothetical protein n=1 Tax=Gimesia sp. TaxID=2024833 RepID=UPI000C686A0E|nr:hypothetical protein [Gimesia sp.]MAX35077.1 hypothetical protein [Gimesia sp.]|tara:strand:+ start:3670 stop:5439 length:1770 start_codon:yes stop_codon:yes gene_type:complete
MDCWRQTGIRLLIVLLFTGTFQNARAQTVVREIGLPQEHVRQTAVVGLLGEFNRCAAYELSNQELQLNHVVSGAGGLTSDSSGVIRVIRGGRSSQDLFFNPDVDFPLMHGDVLIALKSSSNVMNVSFSTPAQTAQLQQQQNSELVQIAILNLQDRPVVFGVRPEIADLAGILKCLRQPLEQYAQLAESIKIIPPYRSRGNSDFKSRKLTSRFDSGTVIVLNSPQVLNLSMIPHSLPVPRRLASTQSSRANPFQETSTAGTVGKAASPLEEDTPELQKVTHPEATLPNPEDASLKTETNPPLLRGPLLQQTAASLTEVPNPVNHQAEVDNTSMLNDKTDEQTQLLADSSSSSSVPDLDLQAAPAPPVESKDSHFDDELSKLAETDEPAESAFWPPGTAYILLAGIAFLLWKYLHRKPRQQQVSTPLEQSRRNQNGAIITQWEKLPPLPEKSLLEQILENQIPVIDETPQIPTQAFIYGRHQSRSQRIDKTEPTLKGPHFNQRANRDAGTLNQTEFSSTGTVAAPEKPPLKNLKPPAFRFDRSHRDSSKSGKEKQPPTDSTRLGHTGQSEKKGHYTILDRVLQAMQGVLPK